MFTLFAIACHRAHITACAYRILSNRLQLNEARACSMARRITECERCHDSTVIIDILPRLKKEARDSLAPLANSIRRDNESDLYVSIERRGRYQWTMGRGGVQPPCARGRCNFFVPCVPYCARRDMLTMLFRISPRIVAT